MNEKQRIQNFSIAFSCVILALCYFFYRRFYSRINQQPNRTSEALASVTAESLLNPLPQAEAEPVGSPVVQMAPTEGVLSNASVTIAQVV